jgi:serine/threonine protein kinase
MAPEVVKQTSHTRKADIWSVGCLVVEMLTGEHPWAQLTQMQAIFKVCHAHCLDNSSNDHLPLHRLALPLNLLSRPTFRLMRKISYRKHSTSITRLGQMLESSSNTLGLPQRSLKQRIREPHLKHLPLRFLRHDFIFNSGPYITLFFVLLKTVFVDSIRLQLYDKCITL